MEKNYYVYLLSKQAAGEILSIEIQPHMELIPKFEKYGKKYRNMIYTPDFLVHYSDGTHVYIEVKGFSKPDADMRRKIFDYKFPDTLIWVTASKKYGVDGWLPYDDLKKIRRENKKKAGDNLNKVKR